MSETSEHEPPHAVLVNAEGQYSLWRSGREAPNGWRVVGPQGSKEECLTYIKEKWTDMRPVSLRT